MLSAVYVVKSDAGTVKIGKASDPLIRLSNLRTGSPFTLSLAFAGQCEASVAHTIERMAQAILRPKAERREWFRASVDEAVSAIKAAAASIGSVLNEMECRSGSERPKGTGEPLTLRLQPDLLKVLDDWRRKQRDLPSRSEAVRRLIAEKG